MAVDYKDGGWAKGEWAALGHDGFTYTGTLYLEPYEAAQGSREPGHEGEPSPVTIVGGGFGIELLAYRIRYGQRPAEEPNTVYRWSVGMDLVTVVAGDPRHEFGQTSVLTREDIGGIVPTDGDLACLPAEMADDVRARAAAGR
jgi:hypothetical protein